MSSKKKLIADLLFGVQIIGAFVLCGSQFFRLLETTKGQLLSMFLLMEAWLCLHLMLAVDAHRAQSSRVTRQTLWTYVMWLALIGTNIIAIFLNGSYQWSQNDTRTITLVLLGTVLVCAVMKLCHIRLQDPMFKSLLATLFKALPQFIMVFEVVQKGGAGIPAVAVIVGNITVLIRIGQIWFAIREAGWDRSRVWLCISEIANEVSWAAVSVVWCFVS
jgi:hypothetical protein